MQKLGYKELTERVVEFATQPMASPEPTAPSALDLGTLDRIAAEAQQLMAALPPRLPKQRQRRCSGLPRAYPKMWMARPESNSLMFEWRELLSIPSNRLKSQGE